MVSPSLLAADFLHLDREVGMINDSEADWLHMDIMDGMFVPNISIGFPLMEQLAKACRKPLDIHYMTERPERYIAESKKVGAKVMTVHQEACLHLNRVVHDIHEAGIMAGVALNPSTPVGMLEDEIREIDLVLIMSVNPGFGGQKFIENTIRKVGRLRQLIAATGSHALIEVDGGVNAATAPRLVEAGVDVLVSGSYVFHAPDPHAIIRQLRQLQ